MKFHKTVINLDRRPDRLEEFNSRFSFFDDVVRFPAIDGRERMKSNDLSDDEKFISGMITQKNSWGAFGAWMSHLSLWRNLAESDYDAFVIFEDDAFFTPKFINNFNRLLSNVKTDMDIVYFGGRFDPKFIPSNISSLWHRYDDNFFDLKIKMPFGSLGPKRAFEVCRTLHGYIMTKNGAKKILDLFDKINRHKSILPVDDWLNKLRVEGTGDLIILDLYPHIAYSPLNYKTDIQAV